MKILDTVLIFIFLVLNEFLHGFSLAFLAGFTVKNIFGRRIKEHIPLAVCAGIATSAASAVKVASRSGFDLFSVMSLIAVLTLFLGWLMYTDRRADSLFSLIFAFVFADSVCFAVGNIVFLISAYFHFSEKFAFAELTCYIASYMFATGFMILLRKLSGGGRITEPLSMTSIVILSLAVSALSQIYPESYDIRNGEAGAYGYEMVAFPIALLMIALLIVLIIKSTRSRYLERINALNEEYLEAQARHFEAVRAGDTEIRRLSHDMKNHFACLTELYRSGKYDELGEYLGSLSGEANEAQPRIKTGNGIADAILNEKSALAEKNNIVITADGDFGILDLPAVGLCTVLANLCDNAVEAVSDENVKNREIKISCRATNNFAVLSAENGVSRYVDVSSVPTTSKRDSSSHGFGLRNIERAAEKSGGELCLRCEPRGTEYLFTAEVFLPIKKKT